MEMVFAPRFEYGARGTRLEQLRAGLFATDRTDQVLTLSSARPFEWTITGPAPVATTRFPLERRPTMPTSWTPRRWRFRSSASFPGRTVA